MEMDRTTPLLEKKVWITDPELSEPQGMCFNLHGEFVFADRKSQKIYVVDHDRKLQTWAGDGQTGPVDGFGPNASFPEPTGLYMADDGKLYVTDMTNPSLRIISPTGIVRSVEYKLEENLFAFHGASCITRGADQLFYIADFFNDQVRAVDLAGNSQALVSRACRVPNRPYGVCFSPTGRLFISELLGDAICIFNDQKLFELYAGGDTEGYRDGPRLFSRFRRPAAIQFSPLGDLFVCDQWNHAIRMISAHSEVVYSIVSRDSVSLRNGPYCPASLTSARHLCFSPAGDLHLVGWAHPILEYIPNLINEQIVHRLKYSFNLERLKRVSCIPQLNITVAGGLNWELPLPLVAWICPKLLLETSQTQLAGFYASSAGYNLVSSLLQGVTSIDSISDVSLLAEAWNILSIIGLGHWADAMLPHVSTLLGSINEIFVFCEFLRKLKVDPLFVSHCAQAWSKLQTPPETGEVVENPDGTSVGGEFFSSLHLLCFHRLYSQVNFDANSASMGKHGPNFTIKCQQTIFQVHDWVLAGRWSYFASAISFAGIEQSTKTLSLDTLTPEFTKNLVCYLYTNQLTQFDTDEKKLEILEVADEFGMTEAGRPMVGFELLLHHCVSTMSCDIDDAHLNGVIKVIWAHLRSPALGIPGHQKKAECSINKAHIL